MCANAKYTSKYTVVAGKLFQILQRDYKKVISKIHSTVTYKQSIWFVHKK